MPAPGSRPSKEGVRRPFGQLSLTGGVVNAYDRTNIFYYDIFTTRRVDQLPLAPYLSVRLQPPSSADR